MSQSGGVDVSSIGDSCDDVDALDRLGDMWSGVWTDRVERTERSDDAGEYEFVARVCEEAVASESPQPYCGVGWVTDIGGTREGYAAADAFGRMTGFNSIGCARAEAREDCWRSTVNTGTLSPKEAKSPQSRMEGRT